MKIINFSSTNIKRLTAVEISPSGNVVNITGKNAQGKTSVLDSIFYALGGEKAIPGKPLREGQKKGEVKLDLGDMVVTRRFTEKGSTLTVTNKENQKFNSPQKMIDDLVGRLSFDPLSFMRMDTKKQSETLKEMLGLDFTAWDNARAADYEERTHINRQVKDTQAQVDAMIDLPEDAPTEPVDVAQLAEDITAGNDYNREVIRRRNSLEVQKTELSEQREYIIDLKKQLDEAVAEYDELENSIHENEQEVSQMKEIDLQWLKDKLNQADQINSQVTHARMKKDLIKNLDKLKSTSHHLTDDIKAIDAKKSEAIHAANMPVDGLSFDDDGNVIFNGFPLDQASGAEQLRVSLAMAMSLNPKLKVIRVTDGSLLDDDGLKMLSEMADINDYQVWIESVSNTGEVGFYIEDGHLAAVDGVKTQKNNQE